MRWELYWPKGESDVQACEATDPNELRRQLLNVNVQENLARAEEVKGRIWHITN